MAIFHMSGKVISRATGRSSIAAAAYRSGSELVDERRGQVFDFSKKDVAYSEVLLPKGAPKRLGDRATLWNEVERCEKRGDAQLAREVEFAIPRELSRAQGVALAREFVAKEMVARGMIADLNVHWDKHKDGTDKPHAHVMLTMRHVGPDGFGLKNREWNARDVMVGWRAAWAAHVNERLAELGIEARIDHRSYKDQGVDLEPQNKIGPAGARREHRGEGAERAGEHRDIAHRNGERIIADPGVLLAALTRNQATFTTRDLAQYAFRHSDGAEQFRDVMAAVKASPEFVPVGRRDGRGEERFSSREMLDTERRLEEASVRLEQRERHGVPNSAREAASIAASARGLDLSREQRVALGHVLSPKGLALVVGYAGTGKSAMLGVAREAWQAAGYNVRGAALSGIAAENLEGGSGIGSRTIASLEYAWARGNDGLTARDVLVVDEAGMVGTRQLERVLAAADKAGAKVVLVGDPEQLQAIEAGAAFRMLRDRIGAAMITEVRRQREQWQRGATVAFACGRAGEALETYRQHGMVHAADTRETARSELIERWDQARKSEPDKSRIMFTHTNDEVAALNGEARDRLRRSGDLGQDVEVQTERGGRVFAAGDRVMFLGNDRDLGVKNGTLGTVERVSVRKVRARLDGGRAVTFAWRDYAKVEHGYAATFHKGQGATVDRGHVLATPGMDRHAAYVGLTRHRDGVELHWGRDDFRDERALVRALSRDRSKDMALDHPGAHHPEVRALLDAQAFAGRRGIVFPAAFIEAAFARAEELARAAVSTVANVTGAARERFSGLISGGVPEAQGGPEMPSKPSGRFAAFSSALATTPARVPTPTTAAVPTQSKPDAAAQERAAIATVARRVRAITEAGKTGEPAMAHEEQALRAATGTLDALRPHAGTDLASALERRPKLIAEALGGGGPAVSAAMAHEARVRADPELRAGRFAVRVQELDAKYNKIAPGDRVGAAAWDANVSRLWDAVARDPAAAAALRERGIGVHIGTPTDSGSTPKPSLAATPTPENRTPEIQKQMDAPSSRGQDRGGGGRGRDIEFDL